MKPFVIKMIEEKIQSEGGIIEKTPLKNKHPSKP